LATACGGAERLSKGEYVDRLRTIESSTTAQNATRLFDSLVVDDPHLVQPRCASAMQTFERRLDAIVDDVEDLRPPKEAQGLQNEFVDAARDTIAAVHAAGEDVEAGRLSCGTPMNHRIYGLAPTKRAERVIMELGRKGYLIGLNSGD
jgi:hypothetical protein